MRQLDPTKLIKTLNFFKHQFVPVGEKNKCPDRVLELYFSGCSVGCKGCQNSDLWDFHHEGTRYVVPEQIIDELADYKGIAKQIHILGGNPIEQDIPTMYKLLEMLKEEFPDVTIVFFTGFDLSISDIRRIGLNEYCDYVKVGCYDETKPNINHNKYYINNDVIELATTNQKIIDVRRL